MQRLELIFGKRLKITKEKVLVDEIVAVEQALVAIKGSFKPEK